MVEHLDHRLALWGCVVAFAVGRLVVCPHALRERVV